MMSSFLVYITYKILINITCNSIQTCCFPKDKSQTTTKKENESNVVLITDETNTTTNNDEKSKSQLSLNISTNSDTSSPTVLDVPKAKASKNKINLRQGTAVIGTSTKDTSTVQTYDVPNNIPLTEDEIKDSLIVTITNQDNNNLISPETELKFNGLGLINSGRNVKKKNGIIYFSNKNTKNLKNDYQLNTSYFPLTSVTDVNKSQNYLHLFIIYFVKESNNYKINFKEVSKYLYEEEHSDETQIQLYKDYNVLIHLSAVIPHRIISKQVIVFDDMYLEISSDNDNNLHIADLSNGNMLTFTVNKKVVLIGSGSECDMVIKDKGLEQIQVTVLFSQGFGLWVMKDGNEDKATEKGTKVLAMYEIDLYDGMVMSVDDKKIGFCFN